MRIRYRSKADEHDYPEFQFEKSYLWDRLIQFQNARCSVDLHLDVGVLIAEIINPELPNSWDCRIAHRFSC